MLQANNESLVEMVSSDVMRDLQCEQAKQHKRQQRSRVMRRAWRYSRKASKEFGGTAREYLSASMRESWKQEAEWQEHSYTTSTPDAVVEREYCRISNTDYGITFTVGYAFHTGFKSIQFTVPIGTIQEKLMELVRTKGGNKRHLAIVEEAQHQWNTRSQLALCF